MRRGAHWPEYAIEAALLGVFMISACLFVVLLEHPQSPARLAFPDPTLRRALMGLAMGGTAIGLIYSPWGKQSGAHFNPATTLAFLRLGKVLPADAAGYVAAHFAGGIGGVLLASLLLGELLADRATNFAVTRPGPQGLAVAFGAEALITFVLMSVILRISNHPTHARLTGVCAGALVALYITVEAPFSGMSMNPARTLGSAVFAREWAGLWLYFTAPPLGMLLAAEVFLRQRGPQGVFCAKLHHQNDKRCIFCQTRQASAPGTFPPRASLYPPSPQPSPWSPSKEREG